MTILRLVLRLLRLAFYILWSAFVITTPLLGAWLSSSLAVFQNGAVWVSALIGLALFPLLPLGWDQLATFLRNRKNPDRKRLLTFWDRFILRTLAINLSFLTVVLWVYPETGFKALSTRGDWMLEGHHGPTANAARRTLFDLADNLEWLYRSQRANPYAKYADESDNDIQPEPNPVPIADDTTEPDDQSDGQTIDPNGQPDGQPDDQSSNDGGVAGDTADGARRIWPLSAKLHPAVPAVPPHLETSYGSVARFLGSQEKDPFLRVKALHDYVADRIAYDAVALAEGRYPPQDAETVFTTRLAVCAGYSKLLKAMGDEIGIEIVYVVGDARTDGDNLDGAGHAWNAAKIEGRWYLIDATWNSGSVEGREFTKRYRTDYLFTPPEIFSLGHLPDKPAWQLRDEPISRGDFMRQPQLTSTFYRQGLRLISPTRSQITVGRHVEIRIDNPRGMYIMGRLTPKSGGTERKCDVERNVDGGQVTHVDCDIPGDGTYLVKLYGAKKRYGSYPNIGQIEVNSR